MRIVYALTCLLVLIPLGLLALGRGEPAQSPPIDHAALLDLLETATEVSTPWTALSREVAALPEPAAAAWEKLAGKIEGVKLAFEGDLLRLEPLGDGPRTVHLRWTLPAKPGATSFARVRVGMPATDPRWIRILRSGELGCSVLPTVRFEEAAPAPTTLRVQGHVPGEAPPAATGPDLMSDARNQIRSVFAKAEFERMAQHRIDQLTRAERGLVMWGEESVAFTAPAGTGSAVLGIDIRELTGPMVIGWTCGRRVLAGDRLHEGLYRYARGHGETALVKRMVRSGVEDRLSLVLPPPSSVAFDVRFPRNAVLEFGVTARSPLTPTNRSATSRLVVDALVGDRTVVLHQETVGTADAGWKDRRLACNVPPDTRGRLRFRVVAEKDGPVVALSNPILHRVGRGRERPSVVIVTVDSLRHDYLGRLRNGKTLTPELDRFVKAGVTVTHAVTTGLNTYTAMPSLMASSAVMSLGTEGFSALPDVDLPTLADALRSQGYFVHAVVPDVYMNSFLKGFPARPNTAHFTEPGAGDAERVRRAIELIGRRRHDPFFLWLHLDDPHMPWEPHPDVAPSWGIPGVADPGPDQPLERLKVATACVRSEEASAVVRDRASVFLRDAYEAEVRRADRLVGRFLKALDDVGVADNTLVVVHADHGIEVAGRRSGDRDLADGTIRIPLVCRFPGKLPAGARRQGVMSLLDVAPTVTGLLGIRAPAPWTGRDCSAWLAGTAEQVRQEATEIEGLDLREGWAVVRWQDRAAIRTRGWRWETNVAGPPGNGRLVSDGTIASSAVNLAPRHPARARALDRLLRDSLKSPRLGFSTTALSGAMKGFLRRAGYLPEGEKAR